MFDIYIDQIRIFLYTQVFLQHVFCTYLLTRRCQTCDVWLDYHGCHLKDQSPATPDRNIGWFCNCCNYRVRRRPRNKKYKG